MNHKKTTRYLLILILLLGLILVSSGCLTGSKFLEDVRKTLCCFSPAMILPGGALLLYISRG